MKAQRIAEMLSVSTSPTQRLYRTTPNLTLLFLGKYFKTPTLKITFD